MKVMLAAKCDDVSQLKFPLLASPKLDGIRAYMQDGVLFSRNAKPIPNVHVQRTFADLRLEGADGELIVGNPYAEDVFRRTTSHVMSDAQLLTSERVKLHVFDTTLIKAPYYQRLEEVQRITRRAAPHAVPVPHMPVENVDDLMGVEEAWLEKGYEGVMLRHPEGQYKHGRSTLREGWLVKLKRFEDGEARVVGVEELEHNDNPATKDELGRTKRSSHKAGKRAGGTLGALSVRDLVTGIAFNIGSGYSDAERAALWAKRATLYGKVVKYRYFPTGSKTKPRFPVFVGFRSRRDM